MQLSFPSTWSPQPDLAHYYELYEREFAYDLPEYFIPQSGLWEMPLWVAHLTALLDELEADSSFLDLGRVATATECREALLQASAPGDTILMSPLAQNFDLAIAMSKALKAAGRRTVLGGNMAPLARTDDATRVFVGQLGVAQLRALLRPDDKVGRLIRQTRSGINPDKIRWVPEYRHLSGYSGQVPLLRLNASHGCLYECGFCGDAWSRQLTLVEGDAIAREVDQLIARYPYTKLIYIGDKTFGQSRESVANLLEVFAKRPGFRFIVQTHVLALNPWVLDAMSELGVAVVEMGFESADTEILRSAGKLSRGLDDYHEKLQKINERNIRVVLNVMGGLAAETEASHAQTTSWLRDCADVVWLANLFNFVPYPLIPDFEALRPRIHDWDFSHWREDAPVVFQPHHLAPERSWELFLEKVSAMTDILSERTAGAVCG